MITWILSKGGGYHLKLLSDNIRKFINDADLEKNDKKIVLK